MTKERFNKIKKLAIKDPILSNSYHIQYLIKEIHRTDSKIYIQLIITVSLIILGLCAVIYKTS